MTLLFLGCASFCLYTYALYPLLLALAPRRGSPAAALADAAPPKVSVVVAARDEARRLPAKLAALAALDYPRDRLEKIIVSDGSTDESVELIAAAVAADPALRLIHYSPPAGKPTALNAGVAAADGDVLVFMDARQQVSPNALRALVSRLADPRVGAVSGELVLETAGTAGSESASVGLYWRYEKWLRQIESERFSTTGASGALYAIRRADWTPLPPDTLLDDFETPIRLLRRGLRTVFEPAARALDHAESDVAGEFRRKVRTLAGNYQSFRRNLWLFDPRRNPVWLQFLSHKVFRLLVPYALVGALVSAAIGDTPFLRAMLALQLVFYTLGLAGLAGVDTRVSNFVKVFVQLNVAAVVGAWGYLTGGVQVRWRDS